MAADLDLWRAAQWALDHHGDRAADWIACRIEALAAAGDVDGVTAWAAVLDKLSDLQRIKPETGEAIH
jgi:hypothetical protein